jgi:hypothetical protein
MLAPAGSIGGRGAGRPQGAAAVEESNLRMTVEGGKPTSAEATMNGQLAPSPGESDGKIDLIEKFCEV